MILDSFLLLLGEIVDNVLVYVRQLPDVSLPPDFLNALASAKGYLVALDEVLPVAHILGVLLFVLGVRWAILAWGGVNWGLRRLPTQN